MTSIRKSELIAPAFFDAHKAVRSGDYTHFWFKGGRGSCKSSFCADEVVELILRNKDYNAVCLRRRENTLRDSVYSSLVKAIDRRNVSHLFEFSVSPLMIRHAITGQQILFRGADSPEKLKSLTFKQGYCALLWFEELDQFDGMEHIRSIRQSLVRGGDKHYVFYSYNPPRSSGNWVNEEAIRQTDNPHYFVHTSNYQQVPKEWLGNAFFEEASDLKSRNENAYKHEYLGEMVGSDMQVFSNLELRTITDEEIEQFDRIHQGIDFGYYPDPFVYEKMHYDSKHKRLYIYDEVTGCKLSNKMAGEKVLEKVFRGGYIFCDSSEPKSIQELMTLGLPVRSVKKGAGSIQYGIKWLQSLDAIIIDSSRTPLAFKEFSRYEYQVDKTGEPIEALPDKDNHCIAGNMLVDTPSGKRRMDSLTEGDMVLTRYGYNKVLKSWLVGHKDTLDVSLSNGELLTCTPDHRILAADGWVEAADLVVGSELISCDYKTQPILGSAKVSSVQMGKRQVVYDIMVDKNHEFTVSGVIVHNCIDATRYALSLTMGQRG